MLNQIKIFKPLKICKSKNLSNSHKTTHVDWRHAIRYWQERNVYIVENAPKYTDWKLWSNKDIKIINREVYI